MSFICCGIFLIGFQMLPIDVQHNVISLLALLCYQKKSGSKMEVIFLAWKKRKWGCIVNVLVWRWRDLDKILANLLYNRIGIFCHFGFSGDKYLYFKKLNHNFLLNVLEFQGEQNPFVTNFLNVFGKRLVISIRPDLGYFKDFHLIPTPNGL